MKTKIVSLALLATQCFAYNSTYRPVQFGKVNLVKAASQATVVSLTLEMNSDRYPMVKVMPESQKNCLHKQTLILFSGYDLANRQHKRTYEIQVERLNPSVTCFVSVMASTSQKDVQNAARVMISSER